MTDHGRRELISSWLDGRLSAEESARLEQDLLHSRAARDEFRAWADLDSLLVQQAEAGQNNSGQDNSGQDNSNNAEHASQVAMPGVHRPWWIAAAAGSAAAVIAMVLAVWAVRPPVERPLATVTGTQFLLPAEPAAALAAGQPLAAGRLSILSGAVEMTLRNGVTIILQGPGEIDLIDEMHAFLDAGNAVVRVPKGMSGFRLDTASTNVLDLGTEFAVQAGNGFVTDVQVYDGAVIATGRDSRSGGRFPKRLEAGQAARFSPQSFAGSEPIPYSESRFVRRLPAEPGVEHAWWRAWKQADKERLHFGNPRHNSIRVARAAGPVVVDAKLGEWSHADGFTGSLDGDPADAEWVDGRMMYDEECLYIAAHVGDPDPMRNTVDPSLDPVTAWQGGGLQVRISTDRAMGWPADANGTPYYRVRRLEPSDEEMAKAANPRLSHLTMWYHAPSGKAAITINHGMSFDSWLVNPEGARGAFALDPDGRGYVLEYAIPWRLLNAAENPPQSGDVLGVVWQVHWSDAAGQIWRGQIVEIRNPHELRRILPFERAATWGRAEFQ